MITLTSEITVAEVEQAGNDRTLIVAMQGSTKGQKARQVAADMSEEGVYGRLKTMMRLGHSSVFEHGWLMVEVHQPAFSWWEWVRHRYQSVEVPNLCLAGDSLITVGSRTPKGILNLTKKPIAELYRNWHVGFNDPLPIRIRTETAGVIFQPGCQKWVAKGRLHGKCELIGKYDNKEEAIAARFAWADSNNTTRLRKIPQCRKLSARVLNEETQFFELSRIDDIYERGIQELLLVETAHGQKLRCTNNHRVLTKDGWKRAGDLEAGDWVARVGKRSMFPERVIPKRLREGIGLWTTKMRDKLIKEDYAQCHICGQVFPKKDLALDHVVPVAENLKLALDEDNLKPACRKCHRFKTNCEQALAQRGNVAGSFFVRLVGKPAACGEEMTYDMSMTGPWHNFVANDIVVHNSFNLESARYRELEPVFWVPRRNRPMVPVGGVQADAPAVQADGR